MKLTRLLSSVGFLAVVAPIAAALVTAGILAYLLPSLRVRTLVSLLAAGGAAIALTVSGLRVPIRATPLPSTRSSRRTGSG